MTEEKVVLICAEAGGLTWPNWRKSTPDANQKIAAFVDAWRKQFPGLPLTCIGKITAGEGIALRDQHGTRTLTDHGYAHFA